MNLSTRIVKFFGGYSSEDFLEELRYQADLRRSISDRTNEEREYYQHEIDKKNLEIQRLTDLILKEHNVIRPDHVTHATPGREMIQRNPGWPQKRRDLEKKDADAAMKQKVLEDNATELKRRWETSKVQSTDEIAAEIESALDGSRTTTH